MHAPTISQDAKDKFGVEFEAVLRKLRRNESSATDDGDAAGAADGGGGPPMPPEPLEDDTSSVEALKLGASLGAAPARSTPQASPPLAER